MFEAKDTTNPVQKKNNAAEMKKHTAWHKTMLGVTKNIKTSTAEGHQRRSGSNYVTPSRIRLSSQPKKLI